MLKQKIWLMARTLRAWIGCATVAVCLATAFGADEYTVIDQTTADSLHAAGGGDEIRLIDRGDGTAEVIHLYRTTGGGQTFSIPDKHAIKLGSLRFLLVGGGGGGGSNCGGGGGAGGLVYFDALDAVVGDWPVTVGAGATARPYSLNGGRGTAGDNSIFEYDGGAYTAAGGGGGGAYNAQPGLSGGSGGGGSKNSAGGDASQDDYGGNGFGSAGGNSTTTIDNGSGGGGAGGAGEAASNSAAGAGGPGLSYDISGETLWYAGGGGGGGMLGNPVGAGGSGIGGDGGNYANSTADVGLNSGKDGAANTGSGGGGGCGGGGSASRVGGAGGSGILIVRYTITKDGAYGSGAEGSEVQGQMVWKFTDVENTGWLILPHTVKARILVVGGGGAGGCPANSRATQGGAGGGGGGGMLDEEVLLLAGEYAITVGAGGTAGAADVVAVGNSGQDSYITLGSTDILRAQGGGGGGVNGIDAGAGGSGGGASKGRTGGAGTDGQGYKGGDCATVNATGGGGGGAGGAGGDATIARVAGAGGSGRGSDITGNLIYYGGGGGGGTRNGIAQAAGGEGGGGAGRAETDSAKVDGEDGLGGGGGGGGLSKAGGAGGSGVVIVRILKVMPEKPVLTATSFTYNGEAQIPFAYRADAGYELMGVWQATDTGNYSFTAKPQEGYVWADGTTDELSYTWSITRATLEVKSFTLDGWQLGSTPNEPQLTVGTAEGLIVRLPRENVFYMVRTKGDTTWNTIGTLDDWPAALSGYVEGSYELTATVTGTANYDAPATIPTVQFDLWAGEASPVTGLGYTVKMTMAVRPSTGLKDFPLLVRLRENSPIGFSYRTVQPDQSDLRFVFGDDNSNLPYEIVQWDPAGESLIWVKVPTYRLNKVVMMCWGRMVDENGVDIPIDENYPLLPASETWSSYLGVWHMDEEIAADAAGATVSKDATANGNDGVPQGSDDGKRQMISTAGVLGNARINSNEESCQHGHNRLQTGVYGGLGGKFTFSGWYRLTATGNLTPKLAGTKSGASGDGWSVGLNNAPTALLLYGQGSTPGRPTGLASCADEWVYYTFVSSGTTITPYVNGVRKDPYTLSATDSTLPLTIGADASGTSYSWSGAYDEIRYSGEARPATWIATEYTQFTAPLYKTSGVIVAPDATFKNFWLREPSVAATTWGTGEEPAIDHGVCAYGEPYFTFTAVGGNAITNTFPPKAGDYGLQFVVEPGADELRHWTGLGSTAIMVAITAHSPYGGLAGTAGTATLSGRTLLANNDATARYPIVDQDYDYTDPARGVYWQHSSENPETLFPNLRRGIVHTLVASSPVDELCGATNIWRLNGVYLGNARNSLSNDDRNFLPVSEGSGGATAGVHLLMRSESGAEIASPCYTNGIGTIYFDAVNYKASADGSGYGLAVEYARGVVTNEADLVWETASILPLKRSLDESDDLQALAATEELSLNITATGTADNFYRAIAKLDITEPVRFRIRRTTTVPGVNANLGGFILVDNIIVSYPATRADLEVYGRYDDAKSGKNVLGHECAFTVPYPAVGEVVYGRARPVYRTNPGTNMAPEIVSARMHYRWRYLNQRFEPDDGSWRTVLINPETFEAIESLDLPEGLAGDVEFWFDLTANAPYYKYCDYSGLDLRLNGYYSEEIASVTNRAAGVNYPSAGTDWFVRLRQGRSRYAAMQLEYVLGGVAKSVAMELTPDNVWRGYLQLGDKLTVTNAAYRITGIDCQTAGAVECVTNRSYWVQTERFGKLPVSTILAPVAEDAAWGTTPVDDQTGYLLFQFDESTRAVSIIHADYQNFNAWSDANRPAREFVGSQVDDGAGNKTGTAAAKRDYLADFDAYVPMPAGSDVWVVPSTEFTDIGNLYGRQPYVSFASDMSGAWSVGKGMWISRMYKESRADTGVALQMEGNGNGSVQLTDTDYAPRGIEKISFNARIGQALSWTDIAYYFGDNPASLKNYTLTVNTAFDENGNTNYRGNASLSLFARYRPGIGAYEFRFEQYQQREEGGNLLQQINPASQILSLYRWRNNKATLLCSLTNSDVSVVNTTAKGNYLPLFISVSNESASATCILAGMYRGSQENSTGGDGVAIGNSYNGYYKLIGYRDTSSSKLTSGTFGLAAANCPGVFNRPIYHAAAVPFQGGDAGKNDQRLDWAKKNINFSGNSSINLMNTITANREDENFLWYLESGRMEPYVGDGQYWGLRASTPVQTLTLKTAAAGKTNWQTVKTFEITGFGTAGAAANYSFEPFAASTNSVSTLLDNVSVRLETGGGVDDVRTDVVLDSLRLTQWRGLSWNEAGSAYVRPRWDTAGSTFGLTNFVFASAWITNTVTMAGTAATTNGMILLSAKRTKPNTVSGIRSPLMDGKDGRGAGLGMISFSYRNAQPNAVLTLQIATNDVRSSQIDNMDVLYGGYWTDVTNFTFSGLSPAERVAGVRSCYLGLHGVAGLMRLVVSTNAIAKVKNETNRDRFGEIMIDKIFCRDEPALDSRSWWGWNLRTLGDHADSERRMYIADCTREPEAAGLALVLNNSVSADIVPAYATEYPENRPFVQTPNFAQNLDGELSFLARKFRYTAADTNLDSVALARLNAQPAAIVLYGSRTGAPDSEWSQLGRPIIVSNDTYTAYKYTPDPGAGYKAFRLTVSGVEGVRGQLGPGLVYPEDEGYDAPVRVLIDEVMVNEAVRAKMAFRNVGAIRGYAKLDHSLNDLRVISPCPDKREQPLTKEAWGVQCEVYPAQLADTIDTTREPVVYLHWYKSAVPWGFNSWKDLPVNGVSRGRVRLPRAEGSDSVYRSSYQDNANSTVPASDAAQIVQYMLEVQFFTKEASVASTNFLTSAEWRKPEWYRGVDFNAQYGTNVQFAAYNLLDPVAPGWAWINEVNLFGSYDRSWINSDAAGQYLEIAAPAEADLSDWRIRMFEAVSDREVVTNNIATFGRSNYGVGLRGTKAGNIGMEDGMVFRVIGCKGYYSAERAANGEADGIWQFDRENSTFNPSGEIFAINPIGIQLVRSSGVVEHEIVAIGTNYWASSPNFADVYSPTSSVGRLNRLLAAGEANFFYAGSDDRGEAASLGVFGQQGEDASVWTNVWTKTPGRKNVNQTIDADAIPTPNGESITVYCNVEGGHIVQTVGAGVKTNASQIIYLRRGNQNGTNITYTVDAWYELGSVLTNRAPAVFAAAAEPRTWVVNVGKGASNSVNVVASAAPMRSLRDDYGLTAGNPYTDAIMDWLSNGVTLKGPMAKPRSDEIKLAEFHTLGGNFVTNIDLTAMYWLDMDPTVGNLRLVGGLLADFDERPICAGQTNVLMTAKLYITNAVADSSSPYYQQPAWSPYVLRGMAPGEHSQSANPDRWTNITFKITGRILNGLTTEEMHYRVPLRYFVFREGSFDANHEARIEIVDPYSTAAPSHRYSGWYDWAQKHGRSTIGWFWAIDERLQPEQIWVLQPQNFYVYPTTP